MSDPINAVEQAAHRRTAEIVAGLTHLPLHEGPKFVAQVRAAYPRPQEGDEPVSAEAVRSLIGLAPQNIHLDKVEPAGGGWLVSPAGDQAGNYSGYLYIAPDRSIELVAVLKVGPWGIEPRTWWPGVYEVPMTRALCAGGLSHPRQLGMVLPADLFMSLVCVNGTAIVTESDDGVECPLPIPFGVDTIHLSHVHLDLRADCGDGFISAFGAVRHLVGVKKKRPFYL